MARDYSVLRLSTGFDLAALTIVAVVVRTPTPEIKTAEMITGTIPTAM
jgi:hypothetical protein